MGYKNATNILSDANICIQKITYKKVQESLWKFHNTLLYLLYLLDLAKVWTVTMPINVLKCTINVILTAAFCFWTHVRYQAKKPWYQIIDFIHIQIDILRKKPDKLAPNLRSVFFLTSSKSFAVIYFLFSISSSLVHP